MKIPEFIKKNWLMILIILLAIFVFYKLMGFLKTIGSSFESLFVPAKLDQSVINDVQTNFSQAHTPDMSLISIDTATAGDIAQKFKNVWQPISIMTPFLPSGWSDLRPLIVGLNVEDKRLVFKEFGIETIKTNGDITDTYDMDIAALTWLSPSDLIDYQSIMAGVKPNN